MAAKQHFGGNDGAHAYILDDFAVVEQMREHHLS